MEEADYERLTEHENVSLRKKSPSYESYYARRNVGLSNSKNRLTPIAIAFA